MDDLKSTPTRRLLVAYESILAELRERKVVRTSDAPLGQWAEWLARERLGGTLEANSKKAHDFVTVDGRRVQVKARLVRDLKARGERQLSVFRSFDFDDCLILLFDATYAVRRAVVVTPAIAQQHAVRRDHVNGWVLHARDELLELGVDVTERFAQDELQ